MPLCSNWSAIRTFMIGGLRIGRVYPQVGLNQMRQQSIPKLWLEPGRLRRHDAARIAHLHQVVHADGIQREGDRILARPDQLFERRGASRAADKVNPLVAPHVADSEQWSKDFLLKATDVQTVGCVCMTRRLTEVNRVPLAVE